MPPKHPRTPQERKKTSKATPDKAKPIRQLKKDLWRVFSKWIRQRDKGICYTCGEPGNEAGHYYHSKGFLIHFEERAVHTQCPTCNRWKSGNLQAYALKLVEDYGPDILDEFNNLRQNRYKAKREDYETKIAYYKTAMLDEKIIQETGI